jgi:hypothetical protein
MDPQVHLGIKELWGIAWVAAYLKNRLPRWVRYWTPRRPVPPGRDIWDIEIPDGKWGKCHWEVLENGVASVSSQSSIVTAHFEKFRIAIEIGSLMDGTYSIGLGPTVIRDRVFGIVFYWVAKEPVLYRR